MVRRGQLFSEHEKGAPKEDGVREEELVLQLLSKTGCLSLRLSWVDTEVYTLAPVLGWLQATIIDLLEEAVRDGKRTSKDRGRREKLGEMACFRSHPAAVMRSREGLMGIRLPRGWLQAAPASAPSC